MLLILVSVISSGGTIANSKKAVLAPSLTLDFEDNCINDVVKIVMTYMDQVDRLHPYVEPQVVPISKPTEDDSQLSIDMDLNMDRQILIFVSLLAKSSYTKLIPLAALQQDIAYSSSSFS